MLYLRKMFRLILSIIAIPVLLSKYYDWFVKKEKPDFKTVLLVLLATVTVISFILEKYFPEIAEL